MQPTAAAKVTDPIAAEVGLEAARAAAEQRDVAAEACAVAAEQRATPEGQFRAKADAAAEEIAAQLAARDHSSASTTRFPAATRKVILTFARSLAT